MYNTVSKLYNKRFKNYYNEYNDLSDVKKDNLDQKFNSINLRLKYDYDGCFTEEELDDEEESVGISTTRRS